MIWVVPLPHVLHCMHARTTLTLTLTLWPEWRASTCQCRCTVSVARREKLKLNFAKQRLTLGQTIIRKVEIIQTSQNSFPPQSSEKIFVEGDLGLASNSLKTSKSEMFSSINTGRRHFKNELEVTEWGRFIDEKTLDFNNSRLMREGEYIKS